jgi:hypothetical protein
MAFDIEMIKKVYANMTSRVDAARSCCSSTINGEYYYTAIFGMVKKQAYGRGVDYVAFQIGSFVKRQLRKWLCYNLCMQKTVAVFQQWYTVTT